MVSPEQTCWIAVTTSHQFGWNKSWDVKVLVSQLGELRQDGATTQLVYDRNIQIQGFFKADFSIFAKASQVGQNWSYKAAGKRNWPCQILHAHRNGRILRYWGNWYAAMRDVIWLAPSAEGGNRLLLLRIMGVPTGEGTTTFVDALLDLQ